MNKSEREKWESCRKEIVAVKDNPLFEMISRSTIHEIILEIIDRYIEENEV